MGKYTRTAVRIIVILMFLCVCFSCAPILNNVAGIKKEPEESKTAKFIWNVKTRNFNANLIRNRRNAKDGVIIAGTCRVESEMRPQILVLDAYGNLVLNRTIEFDKKGEKVKDARFIDLLENSSGEVVMLIELCFPTPERSEYYILCWNSEIRVLLWQKKLFSCEETATENLLLFAPDSKGKLVELNTDNEYAVCGAKYDLGSNGNAKYRWFLDKVVYDDGQKKCSVKECISSSPSNIACEQIFTSMWYDKTNSRILCVGYDNFSGNYLPPSHKGIVYSFDENLSSGTLLYEKDACLFYGIDGSNATGEYYICGEGCDAGNASKGLILHFSKNDSVEMEKLISASRAYSWFTQISYEDSCVLLCGESASKQDGSGENDSWILALNASYEKIWENYNKEYSKVFSCSKNGIGGFLFGLHNANNSTLKIISTDLLGADSGKNLGYIPK